MSVTRLVKKLAELADQEAMWARDLPRFPELLAKIGLEPEDVSAVDTHHADAYNAEQLAKLIRRCGANRSHEWTENVDEVGSPKDAPQTAKRSELLYGYPVTAVIRWMGKEAWTLTAARTAMASLGHDVADAIIRAQLSAGRKGTRGEPAELTDKQAQALLFALDDT